jgi:hypothetical protein
MAKKQSARGVGAIGAFTNKTIAIGEDGVPWVINPADGTVRLATILIDDKQSAVKGKRGK